MAPASVLNTILELLENAALKYAQNYPDEQANFLKRGAEQKTMIDMILADCKQKAETERKLDVSKWLSQNTQMCEEHVKNSLVKHFASVNATRSLRKGEVTALKRKAKEMEDIDITRQMSLFDAEHSLKRFSLLFLKHFTALQEKSTNF